ncbi:primosomal protein N' [uncultured Megasphaera sp.]|uniref:replication restart helicase PriA n=1 Tax=uncultured Megasphaera sp. TaxID=165188 RepID=UPI0025E185B5|nr:primosomal protein N' [uncultured Megasphaera sp.]
MIAEIIINTTAKRLQQTFSYTVPDHLTVGVGSRVIVPFGFRREEGIVVALHEELEEPADFTLKPIEGLLSSQTGFREEMIETALWIRDYYVCNLSDALRLFMIDKRGLVRQEVLSLGPTPATTAEGRSVQLYVADKGKVEKGALGRKFGRDLVSRILAENGLCSESFLKNKIADKMEDWLSFEKDDLEAILHGRPKQQALLAELKEKRTAPAAYFQSQGYTRDLMRRLCATGLARWERHPAGTTNILPTLEPDEALPLTAEQKEALHVIEGDEGGKTYVLHGITGSGKTEIYMQLAEKVLAKGQQVIVLVPEIALTGQIVRRFLRRFGDDVVVMHSQLSQGEKRNNWLRMQNGTSHICIGARSAVFSAARSIGLFIVDEAHDSSYKQDEAPRYHAVAVARKRAAYYGCPVILGSATPALGDYYKALQGDYVLVELKERVGHRPLPEVTVVDMREELARGNYRVVSDSLYGLLNETLAARQQAIILLNRRGYSTFVMCRKCGYVVKCDTCDVAMVYHRQSSHLKCHYCDAEKPVPTVCPSCGSKYIKFFGSGTEKVEQQLHELFPQARIVRLDQDTTSRKHSGDRIIEAFRRHEYDILLGTQMVAKGHDFPGVSAVGILSADSLLNLPAYWAGERTFQLLTQAAGRAGRGDVPGRVVMQTYAPDHYVIQCAARQDYRAFYDQEIRFRKELAYPPFQEMTKILVSDSDEQEVWRKANDVAAALSSWNKDHGESVIVIGPYEDVIKKIRNKYRLVLSLTAADLGPIKKGMRQLPACWQTGVVIDVDPSM